MLGTKTDSPVVWWNKPLGKRSKNAFLLIVFGGLILFEALVPRPLLTSRDWRFLLAFVLFIVCGGIVFVCLMAVGTQAKSIMNLFGPGTRQVCLVLLSCLGMVWVTAFTEYKRINPTFDSYASAVFGGFLIGIMNAASDKDQTPTE
jgi:cytochrome c biogenesis protein CcdA